MSKSENEKVAKKVIEEFLSEGKQIQVIVATDDFDYEFEDNEDVDDYLDFHLHNKADESDLENVYNIARKYSVINNGTAFVLIDTSNTLSGKQWQTNVFERRERHLYCEYQFLLDAVKQDSRVELTIIDNEIKLKKS